MLLVAQCCPTYPCLKYFLRIGEESLDELYPCKGQLAVPLTVFRLSGGRVTGQVFALIEFSHSQTTSVYS